MTETKRCENCEAWSQLMAQAVNGQVEAIFLHPSSPKHAKYTTWRDGCEHWSDDPRMSDLQSYGSRHPDFDDR